MTENKFEFRLCPNGYHYLYFENNLYINSKGEYVILEQSGDVVVTLDTVYFENQKLKKENEQLEQFKRKTFDLINRKIDEYEEDYNRAIQAGMPSMIIYDEIEVLKWLKKELKE